MALILLLGEVFRVFSGLFFNFGACFLRALRQRSFDANIVLFRGGAAEFLLFDFEHLFFAVEFLLNVLFTHPIDFLFLFLVTDVHGFVFEIVFGNVFDISRGLSVDRIEGAFGVLFGFRGLESGFVLHFIGPEIYYFVLDL